MSFVAPRSPARKVSPQSCTHWLTSAAKPTAATMLMASRKASPSSESAAGPRKRGRVRRAIGGGGGGRDARLAARAAREEEEEEEEAEAVDIAPPSPGVTEVCSGRQFFVQFVPRQI